MTKLGKGLSALIPNKSVHQTYPLPGDDRHDLKQINIDLIVPNPDQPRKNFDEAALKELAASIKKHGVLQPIIVKKQDKGFELVAGERRLRAAKQAGLTQIPVTFKDNLNDKQKLEIALIENIQREDLNVIEEAEAYKKLAEQYDLTQEEISKRSGKSRSAIANKLRLLTLPSIVIDSIREKKITEGHARALLSLKDNQKILKSFNALLNKKTSVREVESQSSGQKNKPRINDAEINKIRNDLEEILATKIQIQEKKAGGKIIIDYYSRSDLKRLVEKILTVES
jgi:ParB family transcriptional regulator, chromosome partitioning protein